MTSRLYFGVGALSAATLLLQGALLRLLAVSQFYHFAFLVVSLALLGFGASGSILSVSRKLQSAPLEKLLPAAAIAFACSIVVSYATVNQLPFDSYSIAWQRIQILYFVLYFLAITLPFIFAGVGIGASLANAGQHSHRVYAANLIGSAAGALLALLFLRFFGVPGALLASAIIALLPAYTGRLRYPVGAVTILLIAGLAWYAALNRSGDAPIGLTISPYKGLAYARQFPGAQNIFGAWNEIARIDVMQDAGTRQLPGLSYTYPGNPPPQLGMATDAGAVMPLTLVEPADFDAAAYMPESIAFTLKPDARVLTLEPGGGLSVLQALAGNATRVTAVEPNRLALVASSTAADKNVYNHPHVTAIVETGRGFLQRRGESFDVILLPLTSPYQPVASGAYSLSESYLLTTEAFTRMFNRLEDDGLIAATRWLQTPPSEGVRLLATVSAALQEMGVSNPEDHIVMLRGIQTTTIYAKKSPWQPVELGQMRSFADELKFDIVWAPDVSEHEVNRHNRMPDALHYQAAYEILQGDADAFIRSYPFRIQPASDDAPFFFHFFTWQQTPEVLATLGRTWQPFGGSGYLILFAMLVLVIALSAILIILPLLITRVRDRHTTTEIQISRWRILTYFGMIGLAFLLVEIPLIQQWILLLGHPIYAFTVVVLTLLIFSSIGSLGSRSKWAASQTIYALLVALALLTPYLTAWFIDAALGWPAPIRTLCAALLLAPLAILMGIPFPRGLAMLERTAPRLIPWAWAVNGCASVIAGVLAAILSLSYGFTAVLLIGALCYAVAWAAIVRIPSPSTPARA